MQRVLPVFAVFSILVFVLTVCEKQSSILSSGTPVPTAKNIGRAGDLPSSKIVRKDHFKEGRPLISVYVDPIHLLGPKGIQLPENRNKRGRAWERPAAVSFYEDGKLVYETGAGIRIHGGKGSGKKRKTCFRLYFRKKYGDKFAKKGTFLRPDVALRKLVIRKDRPPFMTPITFEIVNRVGAIAPVYKPAMFLLNGEEKGIYTLIEHLNKKQWTHRMGKKEDFLFARVKGKRDPAAQKKMKQFRGRWTNEKKTLSLNSIEKKIDIDNWTRSLIAVLYCNTKDAAQGAMIKKKGERWFWVNWDMDQSFSNPARSPFADTMFDTGDLRVLLFSRLMKDSSKYRNYFKRLVTHLLNHEINKERLLSVLDGLKKMAATFPEMKNPLKGYRSFIKKRHKLFAAQIGTEYRFGPLIPVRVEGPAEASFQIDDYPETEPYNGLYFKGQRLSVSPASETRPYFSHWLINGERVEQEQINLSITEPTDIHFAEK